MENVNACDEVWTVSKGSGENLRSLGYRGEYRVMKNGVDIPRERLNDDRTQELTGQYNIKPDVPVFLFVGRMVWYKGVLIILEALAALKSQGYGFQMVMVGSGNDEKDIRNCAIQLGISDRMIYTGSVYDREMLRALYCRADLFLFPSSFDSNPLVVREAAACSLPSVLIKGSSSAEGVENYKNGFLIDENPASLAVCLTRLMEHKEKMYEVGISASADLYVSWDDAVAAARARYLDVIDNYKRGLYKKRLKPSDEFFRMQGILMKEFNKVKDKNREIKNRIYNLYE